jgi:aldose 1-epimerase
MTTRIHRYRDAGTKTRRLDDGEQVVAEYGIRNGEYAAVATARGGALRRLTYRGRDLVVPFAQGGPIPEYRGIVAAPWPNRIADGSYNFDGQYLRLPVNERDRGCALHGLVFDRDWSLVTHDERSVTLAIEVEPSEGYPFSLRIETLYTLEEGGLRWEVRAQNRGDRVAPYGVCPHPYLLAGESPLDEWELELPAERFLAVTPDRLLPMGELKVTGHEFDFRQPRPIGCIKIDHAFTGLAFNGAGISRVVLRDPRNGTAVEMVWDTSCPWVQIHTADKRPPAPNRLGLAVEPMTCPPDAFNSGTDLVQLRPGAEHTVGWAICALE